MAKKCYQIRLSEEQAARIIETAVAVKLDFPDTIRQAIDFGLPILKEKLRKKKPHETHTANPR